MKINKLDKLLRSVTDNIEQMSNLIYQVEYGDIKQIDRLKMIPIVESVLDEVRKSVIQSMGG